MKRNNILCVLCTVLMVTGCSATSSLLEKEPIENTAHVAIGRHFEVNNTNNSLILYDNKEALAADGLYYATWKIDDTDSSQNIDNDTIESCSAQLYLLLQESSSSENAQKNMNTWIETGKNNYEISEEKEITCGVQNYTLITYQLKNKENPYTQGISAFTVHENIAVCMELTSREDFNENLETILIDFLNDCTYNDN